MTEQFTVNSNVPFGSFLEIENGLELVPCKTPRSKKVVGVAGTQVNGVVEIETSGLQWGRVVGEIRPGDLLVTSSIAGVAQAVPNPDPGTVVAVAVQPYAGDRLGTIMVFLK